MKARDKLRLRWSKTERDWEISYPLGRSTSSDAHYLSSVLPSGVLKELDARGYDLTTLKFSIEPKKGNQKFTSQMPEGGP